MSHCFSFRIHLQRNALVLLIVGGLALPAMSSPPTAAQPVKSALTSRPLPKVPAVATLASGSDFRTGAGERRRAALPDGSTI